MNKKPLGKQVRTELTRNCLLCSRWMTCKDPNKDMNYACSRFTTELRGNLFDVMEEDEELVKKKLKKEKTKYNQYITTSRYNTDTNITKDIIKNDSISDLINEVLNSGSPIPPDLRIDDRDIPRARNIVEWMTSDTFIGGEQPPFAKQIQIAAHSLAEWCPNCSDEDYFEDVPLHDTVDDVLEHVIFLENGKCPKCKATKSELVLEDDVLIDPSEIIGILGQRSGKSTTSNQLESYGMHKWLLTPNLPATFKVLPSSVFTFTYTATTFGQAKGSFWDPLNAILLESEWFKNYHRFLTDLSRKTGEDLYKHSETFIAYRHKNMFCGPASPSQRSLRGRTRAAAVIDEGGWFKTGKTKGGGDFERMNGNEVYTALKRSLSTMKAAYYRRLQEGYSNIPKPLLTMISSPSARNDLIMTRFRKSEGSKEVYSIKLPTWEFNPNLPRETFNEEFRTSPVEAMRDYGCEPPMAANAWITDEDLIEGSFSGKSNGIDLTVKRIKTKSKKLATAASFKTVKRSTSNFGGVMGIDCGYSNNSFAFSVCYPTSIPDQEDEDEEELLVGMQVHLVGEIIPRKDYPISFTRVYKDVLMPICEEFNVAVVVSDSWQNKKIQQDIEDSLGIDYYELKLGMENFNDYREGLYAKEITHPRLESTMEDIVATTLDDYPNCFLKRPVAHLCYQMLTVQSTGSTVVKGDEGTTDDILRSCVIAHAALQDSDILEIVTNFRVEDPRRIQALGSIALGSSISGGGNKVIANIGVSMSRSGSGMGNSSSSLGVIGRRTK